MGNQLRDLRNIFGNQRIVNAMKLLMIGGTEIIFIIVLVLLLFGGKKIPELMRGLGQGVKSFKDGMNDMSGSQSNDDNNVVNDKKEKQDE